MTATLFPIPDSPYGLCGWKATLEKKNNNNPQQKHFYIFPEYMSTEFFNHLFSGTPLILLFKCSKTRNKNLEGGEVGGGGGEGRKCGGRERAGEGGRKGDKRVQERTRECERERERQERERD